MKTKVLISDVNKFKELWVSIKETYPEIIIQVSTSGRYKCRRKTGNARFKTKYCLFGNWAYKFPNTYLRKSPKN